jgi:hypothetical protein
MRTVLNIRMRRPASPCCASASRVRRLALLVLLLAALAPLAARSAEPGPEAVTEAAFLCDALPPGGRDLNFMVGVTPGNAVAPRMQLALGLGERFGLTADVGVDPSSGALRAPGASFKALLLEPGEDGPGLAASFDLLSGDPGRPAEAALGLGVVQPFGRVTVRAGASLATPVTQAGPHLHAGASAAIALGAWRVLGEVIAEAGAGRTAWAAGPTLKVALGASTALAMGALFSLDRLQRPTTILVQLTQGI